MKRTDKRLTKKGLLAVLLTIRHELSEIFKILPHAKHSEKDSRARVLEDLDSILKNHKTAPDISKIYNIFKP